jgi:hypothetical protein
MQKTIVATLAFLVSTVAVSATDLPSKTILPPAFSIPSFAQDAYIGLNAGSNLSSSRVYTGGAIAGWNVNPFLAVEGDYMFSDPSNKNKIGLVYKKDYVNAGTINVLPQVKVPFTDLTVYAIGGVGYQWDNVTANHSIYNVGAGIKYDFSKDVQLDTRFTRTDSIKTQYRGYEDRATVGVNYKF